MELHRKYRPKRLEDVVGQDEAVKALTEMVRTNKVPQVILFHGSVSGIGKTTLARILAKEVGCPPRIDGRRNPDFQEINAASSRGIDTIRDVEANISLQPMMSKKRVIIFDEVHELSSKRQGSAQTAFLKVLEEIPDHAHFFLCTTHPGDLLPTIKTRCIKVKLAAVGPKDMSDLLTWVAKEENIDLSREVINKLVEVAEGSPREVLGKLELVAALHGNEERLAVLESKAEAQAINLARALIDTRSQWSRVAEILKSFTDSDRDTQEDPEGVRRLVLAYARTVLLGGGFASKRAYAIISAFEKNFIDGHHASLAKACWEVICSGKG